MVSLGSELVLDIAGLGIIMFSPSFLPEIENGEDYLSSNFMRPEDVQRHLQTGSLVAFATSTPGSFILRLREGYPSAADIQQSEFKLRLGIRSDGRIIFRDLYDLLDWSDNFSVEPALELNSGIYHVTLISNPPPSGILGDRQVIYIYFNLLPAFPALATEGIPTLCF